MITLAAAGTVWKESKVLRKWVYRVGLALALFTSGWVSSCTHYRNETNIDNAKAVAKMANVNTRIVSARTKEASIADATLSERSDALEYERETLNESIRANPTNSSCDLTSDELRKFNELAKAASTR